MTPLRIAIVGATGRMGQTLLRLALADRAVQVVAATTADGDPQIGCDAGTLVGLDPRGILISTQIEVACDALVEFTTPAGCAAAVAWCVEHVVPLVSGTTGLNDAQQSGMRQAGERIPIVWSPNMSVGINLLLAAVADLAGKLDEQWDIEICETHHRQKVDAPSGTARALLNAASLARNRDPAQAAIMGRAGNCGPRPAGQIGVHALRMGAIVGEHEVHFTSDAESLTLRHRAFSRDTFAAGALRAARWVQMRPPGLYTMADVLRG